MIGAIVADYKRLDPTDAAYFDQPARSVRDRRPRPNTTGCAPRSAAATRGVPVGYSESIFQPLGEDLGLKLLTPYSFAKAIAEGTDVSAADKQTVDAQAEQRARSEVWVYNSQNVTPDVQRVNQLARAAHIPIATVTETLSPGVGHLRAVAGRASSTACWRRCTAATGPMRLAPSAQHRLAPTAGAAGDRPPAAPAVRLAARRRGSAGGWSGAR